MEMGARRWKITPNVASRKGGGDIPHTRCSAEVARNICVAASETLFDDDREDLRRDAILEGSWAQDKQGRLFLMKAKFVYRKSWERRTRMIDAARVDGCKSLDGVACMERALDRFATRTGAAEPDPKVKRAVQATARNACADGASEAQLTFRLAKVKLVLPQLDFITRRRSIPRVWS